MCSKIVRFGSVLIESIEAGKEAVAKLPPGAVVVAAAKVTPLSDDLAELIGMPRNPDDLTEKIFPLPILQICNKHLQQWVKAAGINKHITWHCARHTSVVNVLSAGANIKTVSSLLGHASIKMTEKYLQSNRQQQKANGGRTKRTISPANRDSKTLIPAVRHIK